MQSPAPFITPAWQRVWLDHFQGDRTLRIYTARDGERLVGVAPMLIDGERAELVGHYSICDYMDVAVAPGFEAAFYPLILQRLADEGVKQAELRGLREGSATIDGVCACSDSCGFSAERHDEAISPAVQLPPSWEDYLGSLTKKDRHEMRRKMRRLEGAGGDESYKYDLGGKDQQVYRLVLTR
jgi:CelD/BcsL family acetyltransferase involved in cellulose biosynthesis